MYHFTTTKMHYSGCNHDPAETAENFCWRCHINQLETRIARLVKPTEGRAGFMQICKENPELAADTYNALITLIKERNAQIVEMQPYVQHKRGCAHRFFAPDECDCGLTELEVVLGVDGVENAGRIGGRRR